VIVRGRRRRTQGRSKDRFARSRPTVSIGYRRILIARADDPQAEKALDVACRLAAERQASITAVVVIEIPPLLPLDAHMLEEEDDAHRLLDRAEAVAESYGISLAPTMVRAREAAGAIVERARAIDAEVVVIGGVRTSRRSTRASFGRAVQDVLEKAPCRVMVVAAPSPPSAARDAELL